MKPEDEDPTEEELREAAALAAALEKDARLAADGERAAPGEALETAALLRHARAPLTVPPAHEPIALAQAAAALDGRRARGRRRARLWLGASLALPAMAAAWLLFATTAQRAAPPLRASVAPPAPPADLLAAQAQATRGGADASGALAALDLKMRAYRRQYHEDLRRGGPR